MGYNPTQERYCERSFYLDEYAWHKVSSADMCTLSCQTTTT